MPSGVVQDGTGTRCPVRFTLKQDISINQRKITVDKKHVTNYIEMTKAIVSYKYINSKKKKKNEPKLQI